MENLIRSFSDLNYLKNENSIACLDSGGLDSAYMICKLVEDYDIHISVLTVDVGQQDDLPVLLPPRVEAKIKRFNIDAKEEFANEYVLPLLFAHGVYGKQHPLSASLSRPLIAKHLVKLASQVNAKTILHAATPSQNSMRRFNGAIRDLKFEGRWGSPYLQENPSRTQKVDYVVKCGGAVPPGRYFSIDSNLFCREFESGNLTSPEDINPPEDMYIWTENFTTLAQKICIEIKNGVPVAVNSRNLSLLNIIQELNKLVGQYGLGRYQGLEESPSGMKVLEVREAPAAYILLQALNELISATHSHEIIIVKSQFEQIWAREASEGRWYGTLKKSIDLFNANLLREVSGTITFELKPFQCRCVSIIAQNKAYAAHRDLLDVNHTLSEEVAA